MRIANPLSLSPGLQIRTNREVNDYTLNHVNTYIIRTPKAQVWIELSFFETGGYLYILEK